MFIALDRAAQIFDVADSTASRISSRMARTRSGRAERSARWGGYRFTRWRAGFCCGGFAMPVCSIVTLVRASGSAPLKLCLFSAENSPSRMRAPVPRRISQPAPHRLSDEFVERALRSRRARDSPPRCRTGFPSANDSAHEARRGASFFGGVVFVDGKWARRLSCRQPIKTPRVARRVVSEG